MDHIQKQESVNWQEEKAQFKAKVNAYDTVLRNKNMYIKRLIKELELRNEQLKQFQKAYKAMQEIAKRLTVVRDGKDNDLKELSVLNEELSTDLNEVNDAFYDENQKVDSLQEELDEVQKELEAVKEELEEVKDELKEE